MRHTVLVAALFLAAPAGGANAPGVNVQDLLKRSVEATLRDWNEAPNYAFTEHDIEEKLDAHGRQKTKTDKTFEVVMLDGSPYERLTAIDGHPLSPAKQKEEAAKLETERQRRSHQSRADRKKRIDKYEKERRQDHAMVREMTEALNYRLIGQETINGRPTYVLDATPKPGYVPKSRDAKVLTGMKGKLWIDKADTQWVKVEAEVVRPVSFYAVATVSPGTKFVLEQEPVGGGLWMPKHFAVRVNSHVFWMAHNSNEDDRYANYRKVAGEEARTKTAKQAPR